MRRLLENKKLATYILTFLIAFQVALLLIQFFVSGDRLGSPRNSADEDFPFPLFLFFSVFIPSLLLSKKNKPSGKKRVLLIWGLVVLAAVVLSLMIAVLVKSW